MNRTQLIVLRVVCVALALVAIAALITACGQGDPPLTSGCIVQKDYRPAYTEHDPGYVIAGHEDCYTTPGPNGTSTESCYYTPPIVMPPNDTYHPDRWRIEVRGTVQRDDKPKVVAQWVEVNQSEFNRLIVGQLWER